MGVYNGSSDGTVYTFADGSPISDCSDAGQIHVLESGVVDLNLSCLDVPISGTGSFVDADTATGTADAGTIASSIPFSMDLAPGDGGQMGVTLIAEAVGNLGGTEVRIDYRFDGLR